MDEHQNKKPEERSKQTSEKDEKKGDDEHSDDKEDEHKKTKPWSPQKKWTVGVIVSAIVVVGVVIALLWWLNARQYESTDDAFIDAHWEKIAPQVGGRVLKVLVDDNDLITTGQPLVEIDPADFKVQVEQAQGSVAEAQGKVKQAEAQKLVAQANAEQAKAEVDRAQVNRDNAVTERQRYEGLSPEAVSKQKLDDLRSAARSAESQLKAAQKSAAAAEAQISLAESQIESNQAAVASAQGQLDMANLRLSWTHVAAITGGRVTMRGVQAGDYVSIGQQLMMLVPNQIWITANYKETQLTLMKPGQPVDIKADAFPDEIFHGKVQSIQRGSGAWFSLLPPENATGNYVKVVQRVPVKITIDENNGTYERLGPGMSVIPKVKVR